MGLRFRGGLLGPKNTANNVPIVAEKSDDAEGQLRHGDDGEKGIEPTVTPDTKTGPFIETPIDEKRELQFGVQAAEATLQVWTKEHLIAAYVL